MAFSELLDQVDSWSRFQVLQMGALVVPIRGSALRTYWRTSQPPCPATTAGCPSWTTARPRPVSLGPRTPGSLAISIPLGPSRGPLSVATSATHSGALLDPNTTATNWVGNTELCVDGWVCDRSTSPPPS